MIDNRLTRLLGVQYPIVQAPMGWIARAQLASAVSNAGGLGIIETSSGQLDQVREEIRKMKDLTDKPFGVNIAGLFVRDPSIADFVVDQGVKFVTTSAGDPNKYAVPLMEAGLTVFHVVPTLKAALKAITAGVHGLVVGRGVGIGHEHRRSAVRGHLGDRAAGGGGGRGAGGARSRPGRAGRSGLGARRSTLHVAGARPAREAGRSESVSGESCSGRWCRRRESNPHSPSGEQDFESRASANYANRP